MYCTQTITAVSGVIFMALLEDFTHYDTPHVPSGLFERVKLASMYSLFFWFCVLHLLDAVTERDKEEEKGQKKKD
jgi:hypothetical protein